MKMKTSTKQTRNFRSSIGKLALSLVLVSVTGGLTVLPAFGDDHRDDHRGRDHREVHHDRNWHGPGYRAPYFYGGPVYAPAPIYYPPYQSPGVSLFLPPLNIHVR
jgi:hypothetical protein